MSVAEAAKPKNNNLDDVKSLIKDNRTSTEVLREIMLFHDTKAKIIILDIVNRLNDLEKSRGDLLAMMYKKYSETVQIVIDCAAKLAPYEKPRLQAVEVKSTVEHRFVLRAPEQASNSNTWLQQVQSGTPIELKAYDHTENQIEQQASNNNEDDQEVTDLIEIDEQEEERNTNDF